MTSDTAQVLVLYRAPGRTLALLAITLGWGVYLGLHFALRPLGIWWLDALGELVAVLVGYFGLANAVLLVRGIPLLMAGEAGILIDNGWGQMFLEWPDIVEFSPGNSRSLRIRLREGARPAGSWWVRITSTSARARRTLAVQTFMAVPRPDDVATALSEMQTRHLAGEAGHPAPFTPQ